MPGIYCCTRYRITVVQQYESSRVCSRDKYKLELACSAVGVESRAGLRLACCGDLYTWSGWWRICYDQLLIPVCFMFTSIPGVYDVIQNINIRTSIRTDSLVCVYVCTYSSSIYWLLILYVQMIRVHEYLKYYMKYITLKSTQNFQISINDVIRNAT